MYATDHPIGPGLESASDAQSDVHHPVLGGESLFGPDPASPALNGRTHPHLVITGDAAWGGEGGDEVAREVVVNIY